jgi:hypothetical protein
MSELSASVEVSLGCRGRLVIPAPLRRGARASKLAAAAARVVPGLVVSVIVPGLWRLQRSEGDPERFWRPGHPRRLPKTLGALARGKRGLPQEGEKQVIQRAR